MLQKTGQSHALEDPCQKTLRPQGTDRLVIDVVFVLRTEQSTSCERGAGSGELVRTWNLSVPQAPASARW